MDFNDPTVSPEAPQTGSQPDVPSGNSSDTPVTAQPNPTPVEPVNVPPAAQVPPAASIPPPPIAPPPQWSRPYPGQPSYPPPPPPRGPVKASRTWLWVLIGGGAFFLFVLAIFTLVYLSLRTDNNSKIASFGDKIGVVNLEGVILDADTTVKQLKKFADDDSIKAIIVHVNSPGGGAAASEEIYREMRRIRDQKKKKLVVSIETVGASGAYYVAAGANRIYANNASAVGSIGVIAEWYNYADLLKWAKLKNVVIKTGEFKDVGNPAREMTPAEHEYLQSMVNSMKEQFVSAVADGRGMKRNDIESIADGRVWTGEQAKQMNLIDDIGDFQQCVKDTAKSVGINGEPVLVTPDKEKRTLSDLLFGDISDLVPSQSKMMDTHMGFYYLWK